MSQHWVPDAKMRNEQLVTKATGFKKMSFPPIFSYICHVNKHAIVIIIILLNVDATNSDFSAHPHVQTQEVDDSRFNTVT